MNFFAASSIITFLASIGFGLFIYVKNREAPLNKAWLAFSVVIGLWALALYEVTVSSSSLIAERWQILLDISGIFVPVLYLNFILTFLGGEKWRVKLIALTIAGALSIISFTPFFKGGVTIFEGIYWVSPGPLYFIFPAFFAAYVCYAILLLLRAFLREKNAIARDQIKYHIIAAVIGFTGGSTNFLPQTLGIFIPIGNYFLLLYIFFLSYSILRYQLFAVKTIAAELLAGGLVVIFLFKYFVSIDSVVVQIFNLGLLMLVLIFSASLVRAVGKDIKTKERTLALAEELSDANERLRKLDQQKSEFVSIASHQLRTPITAIKGYTSMALEGSFGAVPNAVQDPLDKIFVSSERLVALVEDLLTVSRIEQGRMEFHFGPVNMRTLVENMASKFNGVVKEKGLNLVVQAEDLGVYAVRGDEQKISQIVRSILENSVKFTEHGYIRILLSHDRATSKVRVAFSDTGIGMDSIIVRSLFKKLEVTGKDHRRKTGQGLGLFIADQVIRAHGGSIWAESQGMGKGATFFIEFPAWNIALHAPHAFHQEAAALPSTPSEMSAPGITHLSAT